MSKVTIIGTDKTIEQLGRIMPQIKAALLAGADTIKGKIAKYPPVNRPSRASVYGTTFVSDAQRRWFFAVGIHQTPSRRSGDLGRGWFVKEGGELEAIISSGANTPYAPYVQDRDGQSKYMGAVGWIPAQTIAENNMGDVVKEIQKAIDRI
jgi:hypothetical protein